MLMYQIFPHIIFMFLLFISFRVLFYFSNLRRLVHAMILKQPPREWIGTFRFVILELAFRESHVGSVSYTHLTLPTNREV